MGLTDPKTGFEKELQDWLSGATSVVIAGIGNEIRHDDFVGVKIIQDLQGKVSAKVHLIECETVPESFMDEIVELKPSTCVADRRSDAGVESLVKFVYVMLARSLMFQLLQRICCLCGFSATTSHSYQKAKLALLLIEPENVDFGEGLSREVALSAQRIVEFLLKILSQL